MRRKQIFQRWGATSFTTASSGKNSLNFLLEVLALRVLWLR
ncbi:MAG TPA: hypothetical protein PK844_01550 [Candidatus Atribacteria bacterium]|nr:hypothetical protein [Candidatus Atribacteria bacterium]HQE25572.1 hypothetical protein [Candidatus Atribacteria bacterium]